METRKFFNIHCLTEISRMQQHKKLVKNEKKNL